MNFLVILALLASTSVWAAEVDPFDPANACSGPLLSAEKALELLGPNFSVNLAANEKEQKLKGASRFRQIINGVRGGWNLSAQGLYPISPYLVNRDGAIGLSVFFFRWTGSNYQHYEIDCEYNEEAQIFACKNRAERSPVFGVNVYEGRLTDSCFSLVSRLQSTGQEREWAFVLHF